MRRIALVAAFLAGTGLAACGGGDDGVSLDVDGGDDGPDAQVACNPVAQTGCADGEKCTWVTVDDDPVLGKTDCVPLAETPVEIGGTCDPGTPGEETGFDNCVAGAYCEGLVCTEVCSNNPDSCGETEICVSYFELFDDVSEDIGAGLCNPTCNPVPQLAPTGGMGTRNPDYMDCPEGEACYLTIRAGKASCAGVPTEAAGIKQNDVCYGPAANTCFLNGCDLGYQSILFSQPGGPATVCNAFCTPVNNHLGNVNSLPGMAPESCALGRIGPAEGGGNQGCRYLQNIYNSSMFDGSVIPPEYGICASETTWGSCAAFDPQGMADAWNAAWTAEADATQKDEAGNVGLCDFCGIAEDDPANPGERRCQAMPAAGALLDKCKDTGCVDLATLVAFDEMYMTEAGAALGRQIQEMGRKPIREAMTNGATAPSAK